MYEPFELFYCYMYINGKPQFPTTNCFNSAINNVKVKLVLSIIDQYNDGGWYTRYLLHEMYFFFSSWYTQSTKTTSGERDAEAKANIRQYYAWVINGVTRIEPILSWIKDYNVKIFHNLHYDTKRNFDDFHFIHVINIKLKFDYFWSVTLRKYM